MSDSRYKLSCSEILTYGQSTLRFPRSLRPRSWSFLTGPQQTCFAAFRSWEFGLYGFGMLR